jgi:hypothetical protein
LNVTHKNPYKSYEGKTIDLLIAFIGDVNDLNKLQQFKISVKKCRLFHNATFFGACIIHILHTGCAKI